MMSLRRLSQWSAIALVLALPLLSRGSALFEAYGRGASHVRDLASTWEYALYTAFAIAFGGLEDPAGLAALFQGSYWSITLFGITIDDPLALLGHAVAGASLHWPLIAGAALPLILAVFAGRFFCGWICPVNTLLELNAKLRSWLKPTFPGLGPSGLVVSARLRWGVLVAALALSLAAGFSVFPFILPYAALARDWHLVVYGGAAAGFGVLFFLVLAVVELLVAPRIWCRSLCPTGLVLEVAGGRRLFRIRRKPQAECLDGCSACITACPVGVNPRDELATEHCLSCNVCVARCPADVLETSLRGPRLVAPLALVLILAAPFLVPATAAAHHIKGLPHYGYLENYPQVPTTELHASAPPFEVTVVAYALEGIERSRSNHPDDVMVYVAVTDTSVGKASTGPLDVVFRPAGGGAELVRSLAAPLEETVYRLRASLSERAYDVEIRIGGPAGTVATTRLSLGGEVSLWAVAIAVVLALAVVAIGYRVLRRSLRHRRLVEPHANAEGGHGAEPSA